MYLNCSTHNAITAKIAAEFPFKCKAIKYQKKIDFYIMSLK